jgi:AcrR family transcriptional regulator
VQNKMEKTDNKRDSKKTKLNILAAAEYEFSEKGIYGTRVEKIAKRAGVNIRMIYEYFGNKEELYRAVFLQVYRRLGEQEIVVLSKDGTCKEIIKEIVQFYFIYLDKNPSYINLLLWENLNKGKYIQDLNFSETRSPSFSLLKNLIERGKKEGVFRESLDTEQTIFTILMITFSSFSNRYTLSKLFNKNFITPEYMNLRMENTVDIIMRYMCVD